MLAFIATALAACAMGQDRSAALAALVGLETLVTVGGATLTTLLLGLLPLLDGHIKSPIS